MLKHIYKYGLLLLIFLYSSFCIQAQIVINFNTVIYGQTLEGLSYAQIFNSSAENVKGKIRIKVRSVSEGIVVVVQTPQMDIAAGLNNINRVVYSNSSFSFGRNNAGNQLSQTGRLPEGNYEYCFEVIIDDAKTISLIGTYENCFTSDIEPLTPLLLVNPTDGDELCNTRPDFTWQPPMPMNIDSRFRLILAEVKNKQSDVEAISYNLPLINQPNITGNTLLYPQNIPQLVKDKKYAWQVTIYNNKTILTKSDIWTFSVKCDDVIKPVEGESYRELKDIEDGNFYVAKRMLRFSFNNPYNEGALNYSIANVATPNNLIKGLEKLKISTGINKYEIDLSESRFIKEDQQYILKVYLPNGKELALRFIYQE